MKSITILLFALTVFNIYRSMSPDFTDKDVMKIIEETKNILKNYDDKSLGENSQLEKISNKLDGIRRDVIIYEFQINKKNNSSNIWKLFCKDINEIKSLLISNEINYKSFDLDQKKELLNTVFQKIKLLKVENYCKDLITYSEDSKKKRRF